MMWVCLPLTSHLLSISSILCRELFHLQTKSFIFRYLVFEWVKINTKLVNMAHDLIKRKRSYHNLWRWLLLIHLLSVVVFFLFLLVRKLDWDLFRWSIGDTVSCWWAVVEALIFGWMVHLESALGWEWTVHVLDLDMLAHTVDLEKQVLNLSLVNLFFILIKLASIFHFILQWVVLRSVLGQSQLPLCIRQTSRVLVFISANLFNRRNSFFFLLIPLNKLLLQLFNSLRILFIFVE